MKFKDFLSNDLPASVVVFLVALPLCLGIAVASGAPMFAGIIAGIVGGIVVGSLSDSQLSVSGPAAGLTAIVITSISELGSFQVFLLSVLLAGLFQMVLGFIKAGSIGHFFPASVIKGMLAAIGLILILKQIPHAFGYDADFDGDESFAQADGRNTFTEIWESMLSINEGALIICVFSLLIFIMWKRPLLKRYRFLQYLPAPLVVVLMGIAVNQLFRQLLPEWALGDKHLVSLPSIAGLSDLSNVFISPDFSALNNPKVFTTALTIAIVASLETLLSIEASDKLDPFRRITSLNRELKAQGVANSISGLLGGLPLTSVIVRSSANIDAGGRTKASAISHGVILLSAVILIPGILTQIPLACLAGILIVIGLKLTKPSLYKRIYQKGMDQFLPFIVTLVAVSFTDLLTGVFCGMLVAVFFILKTNFHESVIVVNEGNSYLMRFTKDVSFLNKATVRNAFHDIPPNSSILIDGSQSKFIDRDIMEAVEDFMETSKTKHINVELKNISINE